MQNNSDAQLLQEYVEHGTEAAFGEIVVRHADLVYSAALRQVGSCDCARDIAQSVFSDLARKSAVAGTQDEQRRSVGGLAVSQHSLCGTDVPP